MKKYKWVFLMLFLFSCTAKAEAVREVVIFSQPCQFCDILKQDLDSWIIPEHPDVKFTVLDIQKSENYILLRQFAAKHRIKGQIGLPLLFVEDEYMIGWGNEQREKLISLLAEHHQKTQ